MNSFVACLTDGDELKQEFVADVFISQMVDLLSGSLAAALTEIARAFHDARTNALPFLCGQILIVPGPPIGLAACETTNDVVAPALMFHMTLLSTSKICHGCIV